MNCVESRDDRGGKSAWGEPAGAATGTGTGGASTGASASMPEQRLTLNMSSTGPVPVCKWLFQACYLDPAVPELSPHSGA